jgi:hypothetical protein
VHVPERRSTHNGKRIHPGKEVFNQDKEASEEEDHQYISVEEFAKYTGLPVEEVLRCML